MTNKLKELIEQNIDIVETNSPHDIAKLFDKCDTLKMRRDLAKLFNAADIYYPKSVDKKIADDLNIQRQKPLIRSALQKRFDELATQLGYKINHSDARTLEYELDSRTNNLADRVIFNLSESDLEIEEVSILFQDNPAKYSNFRYSSLARSDKKPIDIDKVWDEAFKGLKVL